MLIIYVTPDFKFWLDKLNVITNKTRNMMLQLDLSIINNEIISDNSMQNQIEAYVDANRGQTK
jgi:hypothetical protein